MVDLIADYLERVETRRVRASTEPGEIASMLPEAPPEHPGGSEEWDRIHADIERIVLPGITHWQHPSFFAFFPANATGPAILGELLSAGLGVQGMLWQTSPACTEIETRMLDWMADAIGLHSSFTSRAETGGGVIQGTASESTLVAMVAARSRIRARRGHPEPQPPLTLYASTQAHSSVVKAAMIAGLADGPDDRRHVRLIDVDAHHAMDPAALERAIRADREAGREPFFVCATVGTTGSTAVDPLDGIASACARAGFEGWIHADAAHAGAALVCPEHRWMIEGVERVDSFCFNPHKWLLVNFDCDLLWTRDAPSLVGALSITPEYLRTEEHETGAAIDYRDWQIPLGRRFRALKLWFVLRHYGLEGLRRHVRYGVRLAERFERRVAGEGRLELAAPRTCNLVCFRCARAEGESDDDAEARTRALLEGINATGNAFLTGAALPDRSGRSRLAIRVAIGGVLTRLEHVERLWSLVRHHLDVLDRPG